MKKVDEEFTSFITPFGTYYIVIMVEGLHNAGTTFVRMTSTVLHDQIGKNILASVDDSGQKQENRGSHQRSLGNIFKSTQSKLKIEFEEMHFQSTKRKKF